MGFKYISNNQYCTDFFGFSALEEFAEQQRSKNKLKTVLKAKECGPQLVSLIRRNRKHIYIPSFIYISLNMAYST